MHFVCLCPTHGRPSLVANALQLFLDQDLWDGDTAHFQIFDDANQIASQMQTEIFGYPAAASKSYGVISSHVWIPLPRKYNHMLNCHWIPMPRPNMWSTGIVRDPEVVYVVWDDDDVYLPWHLTAISAALRRNPAACWAHPGTVWSTYDDRPERRIPTHEAPRQESAAGRFHGALAIRGDTLSDLGGWPDTELATYDQQMLAKLKPLPQADTAQGVETPSYCYRWADTGKWHCSGSIDEAGQYKRPPIQEPGRVETLTPRYDYSTQLILRWIANRQIQVNQ